MRFVIAATLAVPLAAAAFISPASMTPAATATLFPWCAHYMMRGGGTNCGFGTLQQCLTMISGVGGSCQRNPYLEDSPPVVHKVRHKQRRMRT